MSDLIERQAAIDAVSSGIITEKDAAYLLVESPYECNSMIKWAVEVLKKLPSVHPEPCEDAVSRQAVINIINKPVIIKAKEQIEALPSVQPERKQMTNKEWIDFLSVQFDISRTSAREMLHGMMQCKKEDNYKKQFNRRWEQE